MKQLYWQTLGEGDRHLVLLHGWGLNASVWQGISDRLSPHFCLHLVDLPGYGRSQDFPALTLDEMVATLLPQAPEKAVWLGWSLGGLVASRMALQHPERVDALVTVASSPCFRADESWPGIQAQTLSDFQLQLSQNFQLTVKRFLALQTLGTENARQDARVLQDAVLSLPSPAVDVLNAGLEMLRNIDLRQDLTSLAVPFLRIYGALDGLVPRKIVPLLDQSWPQSRSQVIAKAAHAPFISHPDIFCQQLLDFVASFSSQ